MAGHGLAVQTKVWKSAHWLTTSERHCQRLSSLRLPRAKCNVFTCHKSCLHWALMPTAMVTNLYTGGSQVDAKATVDAVGQTGAIIRLRLI
jgi:hypothetical protein